MPLSQTFVIPNPEEFTPTVAQSLGGAAPTGMYRAAVSARGEALVRPIVYVGTYPVMATDEDDAMWASPCQDAGFSSSWRASWARATRGYSR